MKKLLPYIAVFVVAVSATIVVMSALFEQESGENESTIKIINQAIAKIDTANERLYEATHNINTASTEISIAKQKVNELKVLVNNQYNNLSAQVIGINFSLSVANENIDTLSVLVREERMEINDLSIQLSKLQ